MSETLDQAHCARIDAVLAVLASAAPADDPARQVARSLIVLEDAAVALSLGLSLGLTLPQIVEQARAAHS